MPLVSVVIPAYNCARFIEQTLASVRSQEACDLEVILVDDGSIDETVAIAKSFKDFVKVIEQPNSGVCAARNRGMREVRGEFIAFVDHDDYWFPNKLANQISAFAADPTIDVVFSGFARWEQCGKDDSFPNPTVYLEGSLAQGSDAKFSGWIYHQLLLDSQILTSTAVAKTDVVLKTGGFDETLPYSEDWDFWLRLSRGSKFLKLREATTLYRQHAAQGSRTVRAIDYRTRLLENAWRSWGLCSPDGRCVPAADFKRQLAQYSASFGLGHLKGGNGASKLVAAQSLLHAFRIDPTYWRSLVYLAAALVGWKPKW